MHISEQEKLKQMLEERLNSNYFKPSVALIDAQRKMKALAAVKRYVGRRWVVAMLLLLLSHMRTLFGG